MRNLTATFRFALLAISVFAGGCANLDYAKNLKSEDLLYRVEHAQVQEGAPTKEADLAGAYKAASAKAGYVGLPTNQGRKTFDQEFPIVAHDKAALEAISTSNNHKARLGQVLVFAADLDPHTSGFLKDAKGRPISVSGRFEPDANNAIAQGLTSGVAIGASSGAMAVSSMNSQLAPSGLKLSSAGTGAVAGAQMAQGLVAGLVAGMIHAGMAESAMKDMLAAQNFGQRIQATTLTAAHLLPGMAALGPDGLWKSEVPIVLAPGIVRRYFLRMLGKTLDYKNEYALVTVIGTYRGKKLEDRYPNTLGWHYEISNMATIQLSPEEVATPEKSFTGIRQQARAGNLL